MIETMKTLTRICLLFLFLWRLRVDAAEINTHFTPVWKKPSESEKIFNINITTESQCLYVCNQNKKCLTILYNTSGSICEGYKSITGEESLGIEEKAWKVIYEGL